MLDIQAGLSEITAGMWVRNGSTLRYQSFIYAQRDISSVMVDLDLTLLQFIASRQCSSLEWLVSAVLRNFHLHDYLPSSENIVDEERIVIVDDWLSTLITGALRYNFRLLLDTENQRRYGYFFQFVCANSVCSVASRL